MKYKLLAVGTDVEVFWKNPVTGDPVPSLGFLQGSKRNPQTILKLGKGFTLHEDNVMPEFGIPPSTSAKEFSTNIGKMLLYLEEIGKGLNLSVDISPAKFFLPSQLMHPQAQEFGCDPDFCVWTRQKNKVDINSPSASQMRTAAAHVHVSFTVNGKPPGIIDVEPIVKMFDLAFLPMLFIDQDVFRRQLYGKAGAFRAKKYSPGVAGVEYRVMSNVWIKFPALQEFVFNQTTWALNHEEPDYFLYLENESKNLQSAINLRNLTEAKRLICEFSVPLPKGLTLDAIN